MLSPSITLTVALATVYSLVFFMIFGHGWLRLFFFWFVGLVGFFLGQWIAKVVGLNIFSIGEVNLVEGTLVCWVSLFAARAWRR